MTTYAVGDIQGCFDEFLQLLEVIHYNPDQDRLWLTGDLVNRGTQSLETLRFVKSLGDRCITVLGNHDLGMLAIARGAEPYDPGHHTFQDILDARDREELLSWLETQRLLYYEPEFNFVLVHAGLHPAWDLKLALSLAQEVETVLRNPDKLEFYTRLYGNTPDTWNPNLQGFDRLRFITNCLTRLRFCNAEGRLDLSTKTKGHSRPDFYPWFEIPNRRSQGLNIAFGHWASLQGKCNDPQVFALDTGCVWGYSLTALRIEDRQRFSVSCQERGFKTE